MCCNTIEPAPPRRLPLKVLLAALLLVAAGVVHAGKQAAADNAAAREHPNIIFILSDDQGWEATGYNRERSANPNPPLTPALDEMAAQGIVFNRFYSASSVCATARAGMLTGRAPVRFGMRGNRGHIPYETETTIADVAKAAGYVTGHFGKWHTGHLSRVEKDQISARNRGKLPNYLQQGYSPPWKNGFDVASSTWTSIPTFNPMQRPGRPYPKNFDDPNYNGMAYWHHSAAPESRATAIPLENLHGDDATIIIDQTLSFIREADKAKQPFLVMVWFHNPHAPNIYDQDYALKTFTDKEREYIDDIYKNAPLEKVQSRKGLWKYYYSLLTMDRQIARLRRELKEIKISDNTMIWFSSDNGRPSEYILTDSLRGHKGNIYEGGLRVPGILEWPAVVKQPRVVEVAATQFDYYSTVADLLDIEMPGQLPLDGVSLLPLIDGRPFKHDRDIGFAVDDTNTVWMSGKYKLITGGSLLVKPCRGCVGVELFDIEEDLVEEHNLVLKQPAVRDTMLVAINKWLDGFPHPGFVPGCEHRTEAIMQAAGKFCAHIGN